MERSKVAREDATYKEKVCFSRELSRKGEGYDKIFRGGRKRYLNDRIEKLVGPKGFIHVYLSLVTWGSEGEMEGVEGGEKSCNEERKI